MYGGNTWWYPRAKVYFLTTSRTGSAQSLRHYLHPLIDNCNFSNEVQAEMQHTVVRTQLTNLITAFFLLASPPNPTYLTCILLAAISHTKHVACK
jgi:hypothetical protein